MRPNGDQKMHGCRQRVSQRLALQVSSLGGLGQLLIEAVQSAW